jgi:hypothetical protein
MLISNPVHPPQVPPVGWRHYREHAFFGQAGTFSPRQLTFTGQSRRTCPPSRSPSSPVRPSSRTRSSAPRRTTTLGARARMPSRLRRSGLALVVVPRSRSRLILSSPFFSFFFLSFFFVSLVRQTGHQDSPHQRPSLQDGRPIDPRLGSRGRCLWQGPHPGQGLQSVPSPFVVLQFIVHEEADTCSCTRLPVKWSCVTRLDQVSAESKKTLSYILPYYQ